MSTDEKYRNHNFVIRSELNKQSVHSIKNGYTETSWSLLSYLSSVILFLLVIHYRWADDIIYASARAIYALIFPVPI